MGVEAIRWLGNRLELLDQRRLPHEVISRYAVDAAEVAEAIRSMAVRGAPAIGVAAAYGVVMAAQQALEREQPVEPAARAAMELLAATRPTAVNLRWALERMGRVLEAARGSAPELMVGRIEAEASEIQASDRAVNRALSVLGAPLIAQCTGILTHCNTGALATAGFGTALGVIRQAWSDGGRFMVYAGETRPWLQGARLTVFELSRDRIPVTLLVDSAAATLMAQRKVQAVIVGADRIAANGDVASKIGAYALSVLAAAHGIPFYVAAPTSTLDPSLPDGAAIPIEMRESAEVTHVAGQPSSLPDVPVYNPSFDITPASRISALITEVGILRPPYEGAVARAWEAGKHWLEGGVSGMDGSE